jgi:hypothetical protein
VLLLAPVKAAWPGVVRLPRIIAWVDDKDGPLDAVVLVG